MEPKITYLFGAGASINALPIVKLIPDALKEFLVEIKTPDFLLPNDQFFNNMQSAGRIGMLQQEFFSTIEWMLENSKNHASIDTFAKKLYANKSFPAFIKLKAALTSFFIYMQLKKPIDKRYDSFIAALIDPLKSLYNLPSNLTILTWNYDFQFEKAYSSYCDTKNLYDLQVRLNVYPTDVSDMTKPGEFSIFKLNGTTDIFSTQDGSIISISDDVQRSCNRDLMFDLVRLYTGLTKFPNQNQSLLSFAWENTRISKAVLDKAIDTVKETEVLITVGYSFPFFNRGIDRKLIGPMAKLKKVYFQAPEKEANNLISRFRAIRQDLNNLDPEPIGDTDQFFLPPEL